MHAFPAAFVPETPSFNQPIRPVSWSLLLVYPPEVYTLLHGANTGGDPSTSVQVVLSSQQLPSSWVSTLFGYSRTSSNNGVAIALSSSSSGPSSSDRQASIVLVESSTGEATLPIQVQKHWAGPSQHSVIRPTRRTDLPGAGLIQHRWWQVMTKWARELHATCLRLPTIEQPSVRLSGRSPFFKP